MPKAKKFFHDRVVLVVLTLNTFLILANSVALFLRLDGGDGGSYIVSYRSNLGLDAFSAGSAANFIYLAVFCVIAFLLHTYIAMRLYTTRKHFAIAVLSLSTLLIALCVIVINALLVFR